MEKFRILLVTLLVLSIVSLVSCNSSPSGDGGGDHSSGGENDYGVGSQNGTNLGSMGDNTKIIFLHHSTGGNVWSGGVKDKITEYNTSNSKSYDITEKNYPKEGGNYPYDYWNNWVNKNGLEELTKNYDVIIWKHCFPVSKINDSEDTGNVSSQDKTLANYKAQYDALKKKMHEYNNKGGKKLIRFIVWTGAVQVKSNDKYEKQAKNMQEFVKWVKTEWDEKDDNIYIWDFYQLETEGGLYLKLSNAVSNGDSHPNKTFCKRVAPFFVNRIINVIQGKGDTTVLTGEK